MTKLSRTPLPRQTGGPHGPRGKAPFDDTEEQLDEVLSFEPAVLERFIRTGCQVHYADGFWSVEDPFGGSIGEGLSITFIAQGFLDNFEENVSIYPEGSDGRNHLYELRRRLQQIL